MRKVLLFAGLLLAGVFVSQLVPLAAPGLWAHATPGLKLLTLVGLAYIMIRVGREFEIDRGDLRSYGRDYLVAMTTAALPWILIAVYFVLVMLPAVGITSWDAWRESLLVARFGAPTSAGVLFTMLAAAGLAATWTFKKARVLAIFDDIDTVLLMVPLQMLIVGLAWQLGVVVLVMALLLWVAWRWMHRVKIPSSWPWILGYSVGLVAIVEVIYVASKTLDPSTPIHLEVLLPAFVLGSVIARAPYESDGWDDRMAATVVSSVFMVLVGLSLPSVFVPVAQAVGTVTASQPFMGWGELTLHVLALTILANAGKMFPLFCYKDEASFKQRLALSIAMWPRGEVGAGVLVVSLGYGLGGPVLTAAMLSLTLNLVLTGVFIVIVKQLLHPSPFRPVTAQHAPPLKLPLPRHGPSRHW